MKIHKIHIDAFGKLSDFDMSFTDGLNCILRENEFGKSTVLAFIRAMFYDFPQRSKKNDLRDFSRHKYMPWGQRASGGRIVFSCDSTTYLLERRFLARKSEDKTALTEADTGRKIDFGTEEIGVFLFDLSEAEFVNTIFIGQLSSDFSMTGRATEDLSQRLANLAATGSETYSFEIAEKNIKAAITDLQNTRGGGKIPQIKKDLEDIEQQEDRLGQISAYIDQYNDDIKQLTEQIAEVNATQIKDIDEKIKMIEHKRQQLHQKYNETERAIIEWQEKEKSRGATRDADKNRQITMLKSIDDELSIIEKEKGQLNQNTRQRLADIQSESEKIQKRREFLQHDIKQIEISQKELAESFEQLRDQKKSLSEKGLRAVKNARQICLIAAAISSVLFIAGLLLYILFEQRAFLFFLMTAIPAVAGWIGFVVLTDRAKKVFAKMKEQIEERIEQTRDEAGRLSSEKNNKQSEDSRLQIMQDHQVLMKSEEESRLNQNISRLVMRSDALNRQREGIVTQIERMEALDKEAEGESEPQEQKKKVETLQVQKKSIQAQIQETEAEKNSLRQQEKDITSHVSRLRQEIAKRQGQIEQMISNMPVQSELEQQKDQYMEKLALHTNHLEALGIANEAMKEAAREMERLFAPQVSARAADYLKRLTGGKYSTIRMDKDFNIEVDVRDAMDYRDASFFSGATMDQIYFALRLSISDLIMSDQSLLPFLLDDALAQYDEERLRDAAQLLCDLSTSRQVILFTCHEHVQKCMASYSAKVL